MIFFPAIDILGGKAVRLAKGDYDAVTVYNDDPVAQAHLFAEQGATWIHLVDLDGARQGVPVNASLIERIVTQVGIKVEVGGGVRSLETIERLVGLGAARVIVGTKLAKDPAFIASAVAAFGPHLVAGVDARGGEVAIEGWREGVGIPAEELIAELSGRGIRHLVYTDIARDGMQTGVDAETYRRIAHIAGFPVIASGGVGTLEDLCALAALGPDVVEGAITGRALYEGSFTVAEGVIAVQGATEGKRG